ERLDDEVDTSAPAVWPALAESGYRRVDDTRIDRPEELGTKPALFQRSRPIGFQQHVGLCCELADDLDCLRSFKVERQRPLVAIERRETDAFPVADRRCGPRHVAARWLDLNDVGAHVGEQRAAQWAGDEVRQLDDANSGERLGHGRFRFGYWTFSPALSMISLYIGTSLAMRARNRSGPSATTGNPDLAKLSLTSGLARIALISLASRSTIGFGVPAGANTAWKVSDSAFLMPSSSSVGTSGRAGQRFSEVTATGRSLPPWIWPVREPRLAA